MIKVRLKEIGMKITELSDYLHISRPTMYKFIEAYDRGDHSTINEDILNLFNYIQSNPLIGKKAVTLYLLSYFSSGNRKEELIFSPLLDSNSIQYDSIIFKKEFFHLILQTDEYNEIIRYLLHIYPLLRQSYLSDKEKGIFNSYKEIQEIISTYLGEN